MEIPSDEKYRPPVHMRIRCGNKKTRRKVREEAVVFEQIACGLEDEDLPGLKFDNDEIPPEIFHFIMMQYSPKAGFKKFRGRADDAVITEFTKMHMFDTFIPRHKSDLTVEEQKEALHTIIFLKHKQDGELRGQTCTDRSTQRGQYDKEDATSPTVYVELVMLISSIDAKEKRDVAVVNIPSAFLQAHMDDVVYEANL
uniref:Uncharacterized protein n=1 Tax=Corethron hystrix TaxID=216773 RepID=A0A7S1FVK9_9STRA|mmetsp:Transcript_35469/g.82300  ORF Transcript_35469/g.82300 Transcript_35469/m.82300 type:complete len:198 (+) Transcript_35469:3962-4555(+)